MKNKEIRMEVAKIFKKECGRPMKDCFKMSRLFLNDKIEYDLENEELGFAYLHQYDLKNDAKPYKHFLGLRLNKGVLAIEIPSVVHKLKGLYKQNQERNKKNKQFKLK